MNEECKICGSTEHLHEHHISYERDETVILCRRCHFEVHKNRDHDYYPEDERPGTNLHVTFSEDDFEKLKQVKGNRTWYNALREEFGVTQGGSQ